MPSFGEVNEAWLLLPRSIDPKPQRSEAPRAIGSNPTLVPQPPHLPLRQVDSYTNKLLATSAGALQEAVAPPRHRSRGPNACPATCSLLSKLSPAPAIPDFVHHSTIRPRVRDSRSFSAAMRHVGDPKTSPEHRHQHLVAQ